MAVKQKTSSFRQSRQNFQDRRSVETLGLQGNGDSSISIAKNKQKRKTGGRKSPSFTSDLSTLGRGEGEE